MHDELLPTLDRKEHSSHGLFMDHALSRRFPLAIPSPQHNMRGLVFMPENTTLNIGRYVKRTTTLIAGNDYRVDWKNQGGDGRWR